MAERINLAFDDGTKEIALNGDPERIIRFNLNDANFLDRFMAFMNYIETDLRTQINEAFPRNATDTTNATDTDDTTDTALDEYKEGSVMAVGNEFCAKLDDLFGAPVSHIAFNGAHPISPMSNGHFLFENFIDAVMPLIKRELDKHKAARKKYTEQFKAKQ